MPKRFVWPLQVVLEQRLRERDQRAQEHGEKVAERQRQEGLLAELACQREEIKAKLAAMVSGAEGRHLDLDEIRQIQFFLPVLDRKVQRQERVLERAAFDAEQARQVLAAAARGVEVLERLKEQAWKAYLQEIDRQEAALFDDLATARFVRRQQTL